MTSAISVELVSKQYRLGTLSGRTAWAEVRGWWGRMRGQTALPRRVKARDEAHLHDVEISDSAGAATEYIWALKDITFQVPQSEAVGIIGRNGAGKSTLLKILSRVTAPTTGVVKARGRIASLLEVGTGFHPELTGRENIFLNGAILGMSRMEVRGKFDEIVDFSGIGQFIDTPVKRYSSGMYVRLAFAVAAHLEPEILVVDEVLAVGDASFQKKCLGKMDEVAHGGRTVLFVSHNMSAIVALCQRAIWLERGRLVMDGDAKSVAAAYLEKHTQPLRERQWNSVQAAPGNATVRMMSAQVRAGQGYDPDYWTVETPLELVFKVINFRGDVPMFFNFHLYNKDAVMVFSASSAMEKRPAGILEGTCVIPGHLLNDSTYTLTFSANYLSMPGVAVEDVLAFDIHDTGREDAAYEWSRRGATRPQLEWSVRHLESREREAMD
jgi:lipopolysaccharide transport system ATP-binding protein